MGLSPYWARVDFEEKGLWFRVFTGQFRNREDAERFAQEHGLKQATAKKTAYANLIGIYSQVRQLEERTRKLSGLGYSPYVIRERSGRSRLFVGAYVTEAGAKSQYQVLKSSGVESQVVER
jgi:hypothetical protein